ncbi:MAG TPA: acyltransferase family protein [Ilumatobacteraceae bacterium]|jgi:peptidoglycan/LPS O-acetylase OafA/YrhL
MSTRTAPRASRTFSAPKRQLNRVPYLPGLDGMRALAVVAVMLYHANHSWLGGGFLGVEVFFVISGYLITLLLIGEHERTGRVDLGQFWLRRFRRLLPAVLTMMSAMAVYMALFNRGPQGRTRGDFMGGILYSSNWYQIFVGQGYTANEAFVPFRHLWSLAVEEQFYLVWPLVMVGILHLGRNRLPRVALWLFGISAWISMMVAILFANGDVATTCAPDAMNGYWKLFGRCINVNEALYLGTFSRAGGLLMGAAFAMVWRPMALLRGAARDKARSLDLLALGGLALLGFLAWKLTLSGDGHSTGIRFDPWLFRGGFFLTGLATLMVIAAVTHQRAVMGRLLGNRVFNWVGTRSYGMYLYHWPIYQIIRQQAGVQMSLSQWILAMALTLPITEASYRYIETPIRQGRIGEWLRGERRPRTAAAYKRRQRVATFGVVSAALVGFAGVSIAMADNRCVGQIECDSAAGRAVDATLAPPATDSVDQPTSTLVAVGPTVAPAPDQTVAPSTAPPTTVLQDIPLFAVGESVMLGAKPVLDARGFKTAAEVSKGPDWELEQLQLAKSKYRITYGVVIQLGTNGTVTRDQYEAVLNQVSDLSLVVVMTVKAPKPWIAGNNEIIRSLPETHPNVKVLDWEARAAEISDHLSASDGGIHLSDDVAKQFYRDIILQALGLPT